MIKILCFKNSQRYLTISNRMSNVCIPYSVFEPVYDNSFKIDQSILLYNIPMSKGEISCTLSHINIISDFSTNIILEDDFQILNVESFNKLISLLKFINKFDFPVVLVLGHSKVKQHNLKILRFKQPLINKFKFNNFTFGENYRINFFGTVGYMFNDNFKEKIRNLDDVYWRADDWLEIHKVTGCKIYHLENLIVLEDPSLISSNQLSNKIHCRHDFDKYPLTNFLKIIRAQLIYRLYPRYYESNES